MSTLILHLDRLDEPLSARLTAYASRYRMRTPDAAARMITVALDHLEARTAGAQAINARRTPEERSAAAKHAVSLRKRHPVSREG